MKILRKNFKVLLRMEGFTAKCSVSSEVDVQARRSGSAKERTEVGALDKTFKEYGK